MNAKTRAALLAAFHSAYITGGAVVGGLIVNGWTSGAHTVPDLWKYAQANALGYVITFVIAPSWRAAHAAATTPNQ